LGTDFTARWRSEDVQVRYRSGPQSTAGGVAAWPLTARAQQEALCIEVWLTLIARADDMMVVDDQLIECQIPATLTC
jgi:hypothetical protein